MRHEYVMAVALPLLLLLSGGCAVLKPMVPVAVLPVQERQFAGALEYLRGGNEQKARELFEKVSESAPVDGVTDEALFRLALLNLRDEGSKGVVRAQALLDRLKKEFPTSLWTRQAAPLGAYLADAKNLRDRQRELKTLRDLNLSLSRDNRDLRQTLERVKNLDIELEYKLKR